MSYPQDHSPDNCDRCDEKVGKKNLKKISFLYLDRNDHIHKDAIQHSSYKDYKQYWVCKKCEEEGV